MIGARRPEVEIGLTGLPVIENDEMRTSQADMLGATVLSLVGVVCVFVAGFGGIRHPLLAVVALLVAMAWSFGYITLAIGHLNILSVAFAVILIGLGIDFGIHYVARYMQLRGTMRSSSESLCETARSIGPGVITGAVTTAVAFFMAGFTEFTGLAELGVIAGGGVLLCCLGAMFVLPALIHLSDSRRFGQTLPVPLDVSLAIEPLLARPALLLGVATVGTALVCVDVNDAVVEQALAVNRPDPADALDVLAKVGGLEIGGIAGVILGAALHRRPVVVDGFISTAGAMVAVGLAPQVRPYLIAAHRSQETGHRAMLDWLGVQPLFDLDMRLGEGTGAALGMSLAEAACKVLGEMATFAEAGVTGKEDA